MKISERYEILERLGEGGAGQVFKCKDTVLDKDVAIKILHVELNEMAARLHRESVALAKMKHDRIIAVTDFGKTDEGTVYLVTEYIPGRTLSQIIRESGPLAMEQALDVFIQICDGLAYAHQKGVLHRDVKPSNVIFTPEAHLRSLKILDFGIAQIQSEDQKLTKTGVGLGTPAYMSPEQSRGDPLDARADVYSMGCLMFETVTGAIPFRGESAVETILMHRDNEIPAMLELRGTRYGARLEAIIKRCMAKSKDDRYSSISALKDDLMHLKADLADADTGNIVTPPLDTRRGATPSSKLWWFLPVMALVAVGASLTLFFMDAKQHEEKQSGREVHAVKKSGQSDADRRIGSVPSAEVAKTARSKEENLALQNDLPETSYFEKAQETVKSWAEEYKMADDGSLVYRIHEELDDESISQLRLKPYMHQIWLHDDDYRKDGLASLARVPVNGMVLHSCTVTNQALKSISTMKDFRWLYLKSCQDFTDKGFDNLADSSITKLYLTGPQISDGTISHIALMKNLRVLKLIGCPHVFGLRFDSLARSNLSALHVINCPIANRSLTDIANIKSLRILQLSDLQLQDTDLNMLEKLRLKALNLRGTNLTDGAIGALSRMRSLEDLRLENCPKITPSGLKRLRRALGNCNIHFGKITEPDEFIHIEKPQAKAQASSD